MLRRQLLLRRGLLRQLLRHGLRRGLLRQLLLQSRPRPWEWRLPRLLFLARRVVRLLVPGR